MPRKKKTQHGEGSVYRRKEDGRWVTKYKGKVYYSATKTAAEEKRKKLVNDAKLEAMDPEIVNEETLEEFLTTWLKTVERAHLKPKAFDRKEQALRLHVIPRIGHIAVSKLRSRDVQSMVTDMMDEGYALSTIRQAVYAVSAAYKWGRSQDEPVTNLRPTAGITMPTVQTLPPEECVFFTQSEAESLIEAAYAEYSNGEPIYRYGAAVELIINTGLRQAEVLALEWSDVSDDHHKITVKKSTVHVRDYRNEDDEDLPRYRYVTQESAKTRSGRRVIKCNKAAQHALLELSRQWDNDVETWSAKHPEEEKKDPYYTTRFMTVLHTKDGRPVRERQFSRMLEAIGKRAAVIDDHGLQGKKVSAHPLRHTFATLYLYGKGPGARGDVKTLSILLGHRDVQTTYNVYAHYLDDLEAEDKNAIEITAPAGETLDDVLSYTISENGDVNPEWPAIRAEMNRDIKLQDDKRRQKHKKEATVK